MADDKKENENQGGGVSMKMLLIVVVLIVVLLGGGGAAAVYFLMSNQPAPPAGEQAAVVEEETAGPAIYLSLDPKFVVSFQDTKFARFMQFSVDIVMHKEKVKEQVELHMPAIRSSLLMMFGDQKANVVGTKEGKAALLQAITENINATLEEMEGRQAVEGGVEAAYFNSFIIQ